MIDFQSLRHCSKLGGEYNLIITFKLVNQRVPKELTTIHSRGITLISNSNWTEWSTIQGVLGRVISKSVEREARGRFEITSTITP